MSKKMKIPSIFKTHKQPWQWPSCKHPKTLSFRASNNNNDNVFKTVNSVFLDTSAAADGGVDTPDSWFTNSSDCASTFSGDHSDDNNNVINSSAESVEMIIRGVRSSERLFFEPGGETSSLLKDTAAEAVKPPLEAESVAVAMESDDPYDDFKKSMQEMVESHGLKEWDRLEELLGWYLRMNGKTNHGFILAAFVDLLVGMANDGDDKGGSPASSTAVCCSELDATSYSSADSCFSSSPCSPHSPTVDDQESDIVVQS